MSVGTPGPWEVGGIFHSVTSVVGPNDRLVASTGGYSNNRIPDNGNAENEANARLIAAAPELLEALEAVNGWLRSLQIVAPEVEEQWPDFPGVVLDVKGRVRAAIAKAREE